MKKSVAILFALVAVSLLCVACKTPAGNTETPAQIAAQVCPPVQTSITALAALNGLPADAIDTLAKAAPIVDAVCGAGATVDFTSLAALNRTALPALIGIVKVSPLSPDEQNRVILDISAAQIVLTTVEAVQAAQVGGVAAPPSPKPTADPKAPASPN